MASTNNNPEHNEIINEIMDDLPCKESPKLKPCIKLPKTSTQWKEADMFLRSELHRRDQEA